MSEAVIISSRLTSTATDVRFGHGITAVPEWSLRQARPVEVGILRIPNEATLAAMEELDRGDVPQFSSVAELMAYLNEDD